MCPPGGIDEYSLSASWEGFEILLIVVICGDEVSWSSTSVLVIVVVVSRCVELVSSTQLICFLAMDSGSASECQQTIITCQLQNPAWLLNVNKQKSLPEITCGASGAYHHTNITVKSPEIRVEKRKIFLNWIFFI